MKKLIKAIKAFRNDTSGAVTVDWVVLTAALVGLSVAVLSSVGTSVASEGDDLRKCQNRIGNIMQRDNMSYDRRLTAMARRCSQL